MFFGGNLIKKLYIPPPRPNKQKERRKERIRQCSGIEVLRCYSNDLKQKPMPHLNHISLDEI